MKVKKIKLINFRNFEDAELDFSSDDPNKKITIVLGDNTNGKTTLVKAFLWCLYGEANFKTKSVLNNDVAESMLPGDKESVMVELTIDHKGKRYRIITTEEYQNKGNNYGENKITSLGRPETVVFVYDGSQTQKTFKGDEAAITINSILPFALKDYFFFDGETNQIDTITKKSHLEDAINNLMDIDKYIHLRDYYNPDAADSVTRALYLRIPRTSETSLKQIDAEVDAAQKKYDEKVKAIEDNKKQINYLNERIDEDEKKLDENKDIKDAQEKKKQYIANQESNRKEVAENFDKALKAFNGDRNKDNNVFLNVLFSYSYNYSNIQEIFNASSFSAENSYKNINEEAVDEMIKNGYCICGTKIEPGSDPYQHLVEAKLHMEPHDYGGYVKSFKDFEAFNSEHSEDYVRKLKEYALDVIEGVEKDELLKKSLKEISDELVDSVDVGAIQKEIIDFRGSLGYCQGILDRDTDALPELESNLQDRIKQKALSAAKDEKNRRITLSIAYANEVYRSAAKLVEENAIHVREDLTNEVQRVFDSIYSSSRRIIISSDYRASTETLSNAKLDESTGLGTVINFSYVIGLMNLAKETTETHKYSGDLLRISNKPQEKYEVYPLVLDAPFSSTDSGHISRICKAISENCDQVIMFIMEKDFRYAEATISENIGRKYELVKDSESQAHIKEVS